jgi:hypothetical protein
MSDTLSRQVAMEERTVRTMDGGRTTRIRGRIERALEVGAPSLLSVSLLIALLLALAPSARAESTGQVSGMVRDASTSAAIAGIEVCAFPRIEGAGEEPGESPCAITESTGKYTIPALTAGEYYVAFTTSFNTKLNYVPQYYNAKPAFSEANPVIVTVGATTSGIDAVLQQGGQIVGRVTSAATGGPIEGVYVCALGPVNPASPLELAGCSSTGANGEYTISGLPTGSFKVAFLGLRKYVTQYYNGKASVEEASPVGVTVKNVTQGVNAVMQTAPVTPAVFPGNSPSSHAPGTPAPATTALPGLRATEFAVSLRATTMTVARSGVALVRLACRAGVSCHGRLTLSARRSKHGAKRPGPSVPIGAASFSIPAGRQVTIRLALGAAGRSMLSAGHGRLAASLAILQTKPAPARTQLTNVRLVRRNVRRKKQ